MMAVVSPSGTAGGFVVNLLGGFTLHRGGRTVTTAPAAQRLLAFVAMRTRMVTRTAAAHTLWPDFPEARAAANLRSTLWRLRQDHDDGPLRCTSHGIELAPSTIVDVHAVHEKTTGLASAASTAADIEPADLSHDILPDWTEEWLVTTREWFRQIRLHALEALCLRHCETGRYDAALEAGMAAVGCEPLRESAHRAVAQVHLAEGNPAEALRQYELYRRLLRSELGLPPSERFRALIADLRARSVA
jgi:DNA-binding SARP family transcriptional activator